MSQAKRWLAWALQAVPVISVNGQAVSSVVDPNTLNLDSDPGFWLNLDQDPGLDPGLYYHLWKKKNLNNFIEKLFSLKQVYFFKTIRTNCDQEICNQLSLWIVNYCNILISYIFCLHCILYLHVWIRIRIRNMDPDPGSFWIRIQYGSGSTTLVTPTGLTFMWSER